jgi:hypothetical protein
MSSDDKALLLDLLAEVKRQGQIIDQIAVLLPVMRKAAAFMDNPATRLRNWRKTPDD